MTTLVQRAEAPARDATLRTLAGVEARRYARHPLFLIGVALLVLGEVSIAQGLPRGTGDAPPPLCPAGTPGPASFLAVLGPLGGYR